jgi:hypothetical protein
MVDQAAAERFIDRYRVTFESFDLAAIAACFAFPCLVVGDGDPATVVAVPSADLWVPQIARIVGAYRLLGVQRADVLDLRVVPVTPHVAHAVVRWGLRGADDAPIYDFTASYALADLGEGLRITAIVHDETPKLMAAVARAQAV